MHNGGDMNIVGAVGREDIAMVYIATCDESHIRTTDARYIECVESVQPPVPREKKWVTIISTMFGCPVGCLMCDAGGMYRGNLSKEQMIAQLDFLVNTRFPDGVIATQTWKIQFARMGEPSLNPAVLDVLRELPQRYHVQRMMPSISSVAPRGQELFFDRLHAIKQQLYPHGAFQLQFSIHTTDAVLRKKIVPIPTWNFDEIAQYGTTFFRPGDRKITLNFALAADVAIDPDVLCTHFDPEKFLIKITPINPTYNAHKHGLQSYLDGNHASCHDDVLVTQLRAKGFEVLVSIGELKENEIGSNCGQYVMRHRAAQHEHTAMGQAYTYTIIK